MDDRSSRWPARRVSDPSFIRPSAALPSRPGSGSLLVVARFAVGICRSHRTDELRIDCFFGLGLQASDRSHMTSVARQATNASEMLKRLACHLPVLRHLADSVYCVSRRGGSR